MRTKTLLIASAIALTAAVTSSQAQVYSQNIVGYVNQSFTGNQYALMSVALDLDGTGTNGTITTVVGDSVDKNANVLIWNGTTYATLAFQSTNGAGSARNWVLLGTPNVLSPNYPLNVGQGFFFLDSGTSFQSVTQVGNVMQGVLTNTYVLAAGTYSLLGSEVPIAGDFATTLGYKANKNDGVLLWNGTTYNTYAFQSTNGAGSTREWELLGTPNVIQDPVLTVGQGFFLLPNTANTWVEIFTNNTFLP